jgi:hypothetical protein
MDDLVTINDRYSYGQDQFGSYGSLLQSESDAEIPEPVDPLPPAPDEAGLAAN